MNERRRVPRGCLITVGVVAALLALVVGVVVVKVWTVAHESVDAPDLADVSLPTVAATLPAGDVVFDSDRSGNYELYTLATATAPATVTSVEALALTDDPRYDSWWPRLSPDRRHVLFVRTPAGVHDNAAKMAFKQLSVWVVGVDGTGLTELLPDDAHGWVQFGHPEWSPDGRSLVLFAGNAVNPNIWITDATGRRPRQVTDRGGANLDPSFSPDGDTIAFVGCPGSICTPGRHELYTVSASGGPVHRLTDDGHADYDPYFSPDGATIAFLTQTAGPSDGRIAGEWNIRLVAARGGDVSRLTDDGNVNSKPSWSGDGTTIYFHRHVYGRDRAPLQFGLWSVDVTGGEMTALDTGRPPAANDEYPGT